MILSGILYDAGGPLPSISIVFEATRTTLNGVLNRSTYQFTTQEDGSYSIDLEEGYFRVLWRSPHRTTFIGDIVATPGAEVTLPQALGADFAPIEQEFAESLLVEMRAEADKAEAAATEAVNARVTAVAAAGSAETDAATASAAADAVDGFFDRFGSVNGVIALSQADYDALDPADPEALYIITGA